MLVTIEDILKTAKLAKLKITRQESVKIAEKINKSMLEFQKIPWLEDMKLDDKNMGTNVANLREDEVACYKERKQLLLNAKNIKENYFVLPKIIE